MFFTWTAFAKSILITNQNNRVQEHTLWRLDLQIYSLYCNGPILSKVEWVRIGLIIAVRHFNRIIQLWNNILNSSKIKYVGNVFVACQPSLQLCLLRALAIYYYHYKFTYVTETNMINTVFEKVFSNNVFTFRSEHRVQPFLPRKFHEIYLQNIPVINALE